MRSGIFTRKCRQFCVEILEKKVHAQLRGVFLKNDPRGLKLVRRCWYQQLYLGVGLHGSGFQAKSGPLTIQMLRGFGLALYFER